MIPLILVSPNEKKTEAFISEFKKENDVANHNIFNIFPQNKELSINQIREIKKDVVFDFSEMQLIILHDFDKASYEAQNAFLKTLEEHNSFVQFILIVKNYHKLAPTIVSRSKIVYSEKKPPLLYEKEIETELERFIKTGNLKILSSESLQTKTAENPIDIFDKIIYVFRQKLSSDKKASTVIREILYTKNFVNNNNLDPQWGVDHVIIFIKKTYS